MSRTKYLLIVLVLFVMWASAKFSDTGKAECEMTGCQKDVTVVDSSFKAVILHTSQQGAVMFANTQQVRSVIRAAKAKHGDSTSWTTWTDKTKAARDDDSNKRRHVVFVLSYERDAVLNTVKEMFRKRGYSNPVQFTDDRYLRVDADIA